MILSPGIGSLTVSWIDLDAETGSHDAYLNRLTERCAPRLFGQPCRGLNPILRWCQNLTASSE